MTPPTSITREVSDTPGSEVTLVTGATGFLGRHLLAALKGGLEGLPTPDTSTRRSIHIITTQTDSTFEGVENEAIGTHRVDLRDRDAVTQVIDELRPSELFHLAWFNGESANRYDDPANYDWVGITEHLVDCFARAGGRRAVLTGSCIEYGSDGGVLSESSPARPDTVYGRCKLDAGLRALEVAERHDHLTVTVARVFFVLGRFEEPNRLVPYIVRQLLNGHTAELSAGTQRRDYVHAWDVALGLIALADHGLPGYVNIGMGTSISVRELSQMIGETLGRSDLLWFGARPGGQDRASEITADIGRITSSTNWKPRLDLASAAADVVTWWTAQLGTSTEPPR